MSVVQTNQHAPAGGFKDQAADEHIVRVDSMVKHTVRKVKMSISKMFKSMIRLNNLKVLPKTTSNLVGLFLTQIGVGVARHFRFDVTTHGTAIFMCLWINISIFKF